MAVVVSTATGFVIVPMAVVMSAAAGFLVNFLIDTLTGMILTARVTVAAGRCI